MSTQIDVPNEIVIKSMIDNGNKNADANGNTIDTKGLGGRAIILYDAAFVSGTSTCDVALFEADADATGEAAGSFTAVSGGSFTQVGGSGAVREQMVVNLDGGTRKRFLRLQIDVGAAGSPVYAVAAQIVAGKFQLPAGNVTPKATV